MSEERWVPVGRPALYEVSDQKRVRAVARWVGRAHARHQIPARVLTPAELAASKLDVDRLVLEAFGAPISAEPVPIESAQEPAPGLRKGLSVGPEVSVGPGIPEGFAPTLSPTPRREPAHIDQPPRRIEHADPRPATARGSEADAHDAGLLAADTGRHAGHDGTKPAAEKPASKKKGRT